MINTRLIAAYEIAAFRMGAGRMRAAHRLAEACRRHVSINNQLYNGDEFDVENEHTSWRAGLSFVGEFLGNPEASFLAFDHQLDAFGPAGDDLIEIEFDGFAADDA